MCLKASSPPYVPPSFHSSPPTSPLLDARQTDPFLDPPCSTSFCARIFQPLRTFPVNFSSSFVFTRSLNRKWYYYSPKYEMSSIISYCNMRKYIYIHTRVYLLSFLFKNEFIFWKIPFPKTSPQIDNWSENKLVNVRNRLVFPKYYSIWKEKKKRKTPSPSSSATLLHSTRDNTLDN